jgi:hypothetical protein
MKKTVLLALIVVAVSSPSMAKSHHHHHHGYRSASNHRVHEAKSNHRVHEANPASAHAHITCDMVRAYVAQVGLAQAKAQALAAGMTASEAQRAKRCLESKV